MKKILTIIFIILINISNVYAGDYVLSDGLNVRSGPSVDSQILGRLIKGDEVIILEVNGDWSKITFEEKDGWVFSKYLTKGNQNIIENESNNEQSKNVHNEEAKNNTNGGIIIAIIIFIIIAIIIRQLFFYRCPYCKKISALVHVDTKILDRYKGVEKVTVHRRNKKGEIIGSRDQYINVTKEKYDDIYQCKYCNGILERIGTRTLR